MWTGRRTSILRAMASFLVETYVAQGEGDRFSVDVTAFRTTVDTTEAPGRRAHHVRSYFVPRDELGVHVIEADSAEAVMRFAKLAGVEVERIVTAIGDPREGGPERTPERTRSGGERELDGRKR